MNNTTIVLTGTTVNPDVSSITNKKIINLSVTETDLSASGYLNTVWLNNLKTEIQVYVSSSSSIYSTYYVPVYAEKINYEVWKRTINKSFQELGNI